MNYHIIIILLITTTFVYSQSEIDLKYKKFKRVYELLSQEDVYKDFVGINLKQLNDTPRFQFRSNLLDNYVDTLMFKNGKLLFVGSDKQNDDNSSLSQLKTNVYSFDLIYQLERLLNIMNKVGVKLVRTYYHNELTNELSETKESNKYWLIFKLDEKTQLNFLNLERERVTDGVVIYSWYDENWVLGASIIN